MCSDPWLCRRHSSGGVYLRWCHCHCLTPARPTLPGLSVRLSVRSVLPVRWSLATRLSSGRRRLRLPRRCEDVRHASTVLSSDLTTHSRSAGGSGITLPLRSLQVGLTSEHHVDYATLTASITTTASITLTAA